METHAPDRSEQALNMLFDLYFKPIRPSFSYCYDLVKMWGEQVGYKLPSITTMRRRLDQRIAARGFASPVISGGKVNRFRFKVREAD